MKRKDVVKKLKDDYVLAAKNYLMNGPPLDDFYYGRMDGLETALMWMGEDELTVRSLFAYAKAEVEKAKNRKEEI